MVGNHTNKYLYCVCNNLFFDISLTTAYRIKAAFKGQSYIVLYGKKQQTNRTPFETTDSSQIDITNDNGFVDIYILYTLIKYEDELNIADCYAEYLF